MIVTSIDIGSTWTKGASFTVDETGVLRVLKREATPTTVDDLAEGFFHVLDALGGPADRRSLFYSSSAKGGLAVAALGLVPEVTAEMAKVAAYSAGARLSQVYAYRLTRADIAALEANPPDILLFAGGTDGGNTEYVRANAQALAASRLFCPIVYAGNRSVRDEVADLLGDRDITLVDNLLPELNRPNPEPARAAMREIFLSTIVAGKGLDGIIRATGAEPVPTPYAVYEFSRLIQAHVPGWETFMLVDMGGATTDVYSGQIDTPVVGTVHRGLPEPPLKRTVEGDLGLRVSAEAAAVAGRAIVEETLGHDADRLAVFAEHARAVAAAPASLPANAQGKRLDALLAGTCLATACARHAGRMYPVSTVDGVVNVRMGRDLTGVRQVIGSGGYLAATDDFDPNPWLSRVAIDEAGRQILLPRGVRYFRDAQYLIPLLANAARRWPVAAAKAAIRHVLPVTDIAA